MKTVLMIMYITSNLSIKYLSIVNNNYTFFFNSFRQKMFLKQNSARHLSKKINLLDINLMNILEYFQQIYGVCMI